jgi:hypothetical protein
MKIRKSKVLQFNLRKYFHGFFLYCGFTLNIIFYGGHGRNIGCNIEKLSKPTNLYYISNKNHTHKWALALF